MKFVDLLAEFPYVLERERDLPEVEQTQFVLRGLDWATQDKVEKLTSSGKMHIPNVGQLKKGTKALPESASMEWDVKANNLEVQYVVLEYGLVRIENAEESPEMFDEKASTKTKRDWISRYLPSDVREELVGAIRQHGVLEEDEAKN